MDHTRPSKQFQAAAGYLAKRGPTPNLPAFDPLWLSSSPIHTVGVEVMAAEGIAERLHNQSATGGRRWALGMAGLAACAAIVAGVVLLRGPQTSTVAGTPTFGVVVFVRGKAIRVRGQQQELLRVGNDIREGDRLRTQKGSLVDVTLADRSIVRLHGSTVLTASSLRRTPKGNHKTALHLRRGGLLHLVRRRSPADGYRVTTPTAIASVRGTRFQMIEGRKRARIIVTEGSVAVTAQHIPGKELVVAGGNEALVEPPAGAVLRTNSTAAARLRPEFAEMLKHSDGADLKTLKSIHRRSGIRTEQDLKKAYQKNIELVILDDGRKLRGAVVSMQGGKLIIHTLKGVELVDMSHIIKVKILD